MSTPDTDNDGFSDAEENAGVVLADGSLFPGAQSGTTRANRLDPNSPDLFVILQQTPTTNVPSNPFEFLTRLGVTVHPIGAGQAPVSLQLGCIQRAVTVVESLDTNGTIVGSAEQGIPTTGLNVATVFSQRIVNHVTSTKGFRDEATIARWIKHTIAHEAAHMLFRETVYNKRFGGYHVKTGEGTIMDQSIVVNGTNYLIPDTYGAHDPVGTYR